MTVNTEAMIFAVAVGLTLYGLALLLDWLATALGLPDLVIAS